MTDHEQRPGVTYALGGAIPASVGIVLGILELRGDELRDLEFTLWEYLDPDALDSLVDDESRDCSLEIDLVIENYDVQLVAGERVSVFERAHADGGTGRPLD